MLKKTVLLIVMLQLCLLAQGLNNFHTVYEVKFGMLGHIGTIDARMHSQNDRYQIEVSGKTKGVAKIFGTERTDTQKSVGKIVDGYLVPLEYMKSRETFTKKQIKRYTFDHQNRTISTYELKIKKEKILSSVDKVFGKTEDDVEFTETKTEKTGKLQRYTKTDLLTLFFNLKKILNGSLENVKLTKIYTAGASKRDKYIQIYTPAETILLEAKEMLGSDGHILAVDLNQKVFLSKTGNLLVKFNDEGICTKAILRDVLFGGDVLVELKEFKSL